MYSVLVTGPESCGNRLLSRICSLLTGLPVVEPNPRRAKPLVTYLEQGPHVFHRSLPHGADRRFHSVEWLVALAEHHGQGLRIVVPMRDRTISTLSKLRQHTSGRQEAEREQDEAARIIRGIRRQWPDTSLLVSYEALMWLRQAYVDEIAAWLGVPSQAVLGLSDANPKYLWEPE